MTETTDSVTFDDLGLDPKVLKAIKDVGYETPSPIQAEAIPPLLDGGHVVGLAQTGTGKTAAFALPILSRIDLSQKTPQVLVLAPTRELALQVSEAFEKYASGIRGLHVLPVYGGQGYGVQLSALRRGVHVVVGTPGRVMDHIEKGTLDLSELRFVVLDEADEMLNMGFAEDVESILSGTPDDKQVALFSATMPSQIKRIVKRHAPDATEIKVKSTSTTAANVEQRFLKVAHHNKVDALTRILEVENFDGMIIFVRTKHATEEVAEKLRARGFSAAAINGDVAQVQRERTVEQLRKSKLDILVATDVAARGLDVPRISHVINHDIPTDTESYVHRIGRTGRAGRSGVAISFVTPRENHLLRAIEKTNKTTLTEMRLPSVSDVNAFRVSKFNDAIGQAMSDPQIGLFRELIEDYERNNDVPALDIAAAIAVLSQDGQPLFLEDMPEPLRQPTKERSSERKGRERRGFASYRLEVGKRHHVEPRQIVGALANEGGLSREDFGKIDIKPAFSIVELPVDMDPAVLDKLSGTRISGVLINIKQDKFDRGHKRGHTGPTGSPNKTWTATGGSSYSGTKKPRHKKRDQA
ncbi:DEAD/DEAH box helicase [Nocardioides marmoriginsengisoli]|uniref:ATP-dependent RNA helicase DeaD n=1 Tax=Nocardioides marmoriginsengisoli TaxID=661483 RepID=A0A3N0CJM9_9ACTN|nr:DEAD/DEAH box helicase [Nocardioides marmoriginsengisoli]RNL63667.1 DEAD/DEAH box helicase [Nocardioides marmoriginsengisoli]